LELKRRNNFPKDSLSDQEEKLTSILLKMASRKIPTQIEDEENKTRLGTRAFRHSEENKMDLKDLNG
jgi:hypothetical protein